MKCKYFFSALSLLFLLLLYNFTNFFQLPQIHRCPFRFDVTIQTTKPKFGGSRAKRTTPQFSITSFSTTQHLHPTCGMTSPQIYPRTSVVLSLQCQLGAIIHSEFFRGTRSGSVFQAYSRSISAQPSLVFLFIIHRMSSERATCLEILSSSGR